MKWILTLLFIVIVGVPAYIIEEKKNERKQVDMTVHTLRLGEREFDLEVLATPAERELGLSGRESLDNNKAVLFVFKELGFHGFWMKDMRFPIDIVWLDDKKKVVHIIEGATPESYPHVFYPDKVAMYVLEFNKGVVKEQKIAVENSFVF